MTRAAVFCLVALCLAIAHRGANAAETIVFKSLSLANFAAAYDGAPSGKEVELSAELSLPETGSAPYPAVVLVHGSGHPENMSAWWADVVPELNKNGIATLVIDSFTGRGVGRKGSSSDQAKISKASRVFDAFRALEFLKHDPRIDGARVGVTGYSFGGIVSFLAANKKISTAMSGDGVPFAAHMPVYPSCQSRPAHSTLTGAPLTFLLGGKDAYTPAHFCEALVQDLTDTGEKVDLIKYPEAHHSWIRSFSVRRCPNCWTFTRCGVSTITSDGYEKSEKYGFSTKGGWGSYVKKLARKCGKRGVLIGQNREARSAAIAETVKFFKMNL